MTLNTIIGRSMQAAAIVTMLGGVYGSLDYLNQLTKLQDNLSERAKEFQGLEYRLDHGSVSIRTLLEKPELLDQYKRDDARYKEITSNPAVMAAIKAEISSVEDIQNNLRDDFIFFPGLILLGQIMGFAGHNYCHPKKKEI